MTDERKEGQLKPLNIKDDRPDYEWNGEFDQDAIDRGVKADKKRRAAQPSPRGSEALREWAARMRRDAKECEMHPRSCYCGPQLNAYADAMDRSTALAAATAERTPDPQLIKAEASLMPRCKHGVWLADHCYQCDADRQPPAERTLPLSEEAQKFLNLLVRLTPHQFATARVDVLRELLADWRSAAPPQPEPRGSEAGWLIERGGLCLGFCEYRFTWVTFTNEDALRFSRERDAYSFKEAMRWEPKWKVLDESKVTEHLWG